MPTKKIEKKGLQRFDSVKLRDLIDSSDSYRSLIYGVLTVVVVFVVIMVGVNMFSTRHGGVIDEKAAVTEKVSTPQLQIHTVAPGETLWGIAEKEYGDGFKWQEIAKANNITNPSQLEKGVNLTIPALTPSPAIAESTKPTVIPTTAPVVQNTVTPVQNGTDLKISGTTYTIAHGDNLWSIAVRAYGDGYKWIDIAKINGLTNPNLIFSGNVLQIPR